MTFGILGETLGTIAEVFGLRQKQGMFCPESCPLLQSGQRYGHLIHADKQDKVPATLNFGIDLLIYQNIVLEDSRSIAKRRHRNLKTRISDSYTEIIEKLANVETTVLNDGIKSRNRVKELLSRSPVKGIKDSQNDHKILNAILDDQKVIIDQIAELRLKSISDHNLLLKISPADIIAAVEKQSNKQSRELAEEFAKLKKDVKELLDEIKFDPDKPKHTELVTEQNSQEILRLSQKVIPLMEKTQSTLETVDSTLAYCVKRLS